MKKISKSEQRAAASRNETKSKAKPNSKRANSKRGKKVDGTRIKTAVPEIGPVKQIKTAPRKPEEKVAVESLERRERGGVVKRDIRSGEVHRPRKRTLRVERPTVVEEAKPSVLKDNRVSPMTDPELVARRIKEQRKGSSPGKEVSAKIQTKEITAKSTASIAKGLPPAPDGSTEAPERAGSVTHAGAPAIEEAQTPSPYKQPEPQSAIPQLQHLSPHLLAKIQALLQKKFLPPSSEPVDDYVVTLFIAAAGSPENLIGYLRQINGRNNLPCPWGAMDVVNSLMERFLPDSARGQWMFR